MQLFFYDCSFFERALRLDLFCLCVCLCPTRPCGTVRPRPPPPPALSGQRRRERLPAAMSRKGVKLLVDSLTRSAKHCESSPSCRSRAAAARPPRAVPVLILSGPVRFPWEALSRRPLGNSGCGGAVAGVGVTALACLCGCLVFYQLNLQPVFACVWVEQLTKAKWNVWSTSSTRWWPGPAASLLGPASTAPCSETPCTAPLA